MMNILKMATITTRLQDLSEVLQAWSADKLILVGEVASRANDKMDPPPSWLRRTARALRKKAFREEVLWTASSKHLEDLQGKCARDTRFSRMRLCELHPTDDTPEDVLGSSPYKNLYAFIVRGRGQMGEIRLTMLGDDLDELVASVHKYGSGIAGVIEASRGGEAPQRQLYEKIAEEASRDEDAETAAANTVDAERAAAAVSADARKKRLEDEKFARKDFASAAKTFKKTAWKASSDDAGTRVMTVDREALSITKKSLENTKKKAQKEVVKMQKQDSVPDPPKVVAAFTEWERAQRSGSVKRTLTAFEKYMSDPKNKARVDSMGL